MQPGLQNGSLEVERFVISMTIALLGLVALLVVSAAAMSNEKML